MIVRTFKIDATSDTSDKEPAIIVRLRVLITPADLPPTPVAGSPRPMTENKSNVGRRCDNGTLFIERRHVRLNYPVAACACDKPGTAAGSPP